MQPSGVFERVRKVLAEFWCNGSAADREGGQISPETTYEGLNFDDLAYLEFAVELEEEFDIAIHDGDFDGWKTVQDAVTYVSRKLEAKT